MSRCPSRWAALGLAVFAAAMAADIAGAQSKFPGVGRPATPAEVKAWDVDVRADFTGLPKGSGSVANGQEIWEARCASCHGIFGESNQVFSPIVGGTTKEDTRTGRVAALRRSGEQRTTLMKLPTVSTLWDYVNRAMPWNAPKTLTVDEVYAVVAYILNLGDIVPADFVLSDQNIGEVQHRLPNRFGMRPYRGLWDLHGTPDVNNLACMKDCLPEVKITSELPPQARNAHGNLAEQNRLIGAVRGADTARPPLARGAGESVRELTRRMAASLTTPPESPGLALAQKYACVGCHDVDRRLVGPSFKEIAAKYPAAEDATGVLVQKVRSGSVGVWGSVPMPPQPQAGEGDLATIVRWILAGLK